MRNLLNKHNVQCMDELNKELDAISAKSKTAQLWIDLSDQATYYFTEIHSS